MPSTRIPPSHPPLRLPVSPHSPAYTQHPSGRSSLRSALRAKALFTQGRSQSFLTALTREWPWLTCHGPAHVTWRCHWGQLPAGHGAVTCPAPALDVRLGLTTSMWVPLRDFLKRKRLCHSPFLFLLPLPGGRVPQGLRGGWSPNLEKYWEHDSLHGKTPTAKLGHAG